MYLSQALSLSLSHTHTADADDGARAADGGVGALISTEFTYESLHYQRERKRKENERVCSSGSSFTAAGSANSPLNLLLVRGRFRYSMPVCLPVGRSVGWLSAQVDHVPDKGGKKIEEDRQASSFGERYTLHRRRAQKAYFFSSGNTATSLPAYFELEYFTLHC